MNVICKATKDNCYSLDFLFYPDTLFCQYLNVIDNSKTGQICEQSLRWMSK